MTQPTPSNSAAVQPGALSQRALALAGPLLGLTLFVLAAWILRREFQTVHMNDVWGHLALIPHARLGLAVALTIVGYLVLTAYDTLAFRYVGNSLAYSRIALSSFVAYVFAHNVGLSFFGSTAVRYRMLSAWGVKSEDIARVIAFTMLTFWMGFFLLGGVLHTLWPLPLAIERLPLSDSRPIGALFLALTAGYVALTRLRKDALVFHGFRIDPPGLPTTLAQFAVSCVDWLLAASVLYTVLPSTPGLGFPLFVGAYLLAQIAGLASHVPGGLGVFETAMVLLLKAWIPGDELLASIVAYRVIYYLLPMVVAVTLFAGYEVRERRALFERTGAWLQAGMTALVPRLLSVTTFLAGAMLLFSGATPELPERVAWLRQTLPIPLIEASKLLGSVFGVALLVLANGLRRRIDAAYLATLLLLGAGAIASLAKGLDWEEASVLAIMALVLAPCRGFFYRRSSLLAQPFSQAWWFAVAVVVIGSLISLELAYRHIEYSNDLWWRFGAADLAPRSLRAMFVAGVALLGVGAVRLLRPVPPIPDPPKPDELDRAQSIAAQAPRTNAYLALLGDKQLLFSADGTGFLMYGIAGNTWVAMGDPAGPTAAQEELVWRFAEMADQHGARPVFYEVSGDVLPIYLELGMDLRKLGEEGRVPLKDFSLEGSARKGLRATVNRMAREGGSFEILPASAVPPILDELERISDAWLTEKNTREKRFSLGFFDRAYLARLPVAVVRKNERIVAFANVWPSDSRIEVSSDLMRYDADAPPGVMDYLFTQLMLWGREQGYQHYSLGMAPLSGLEQHRLAPLWNRLGALLFRNGEHFYNFQGLRQFKEKFDPEWEPRYLASPGGWFGAPVVLTRIASLVSGGVAGVVSK